MPFSGQQNRISGKRVLGRISHNFETSEIFGLESRRTLREHLVAFGVLTVASGVSTLNTSGRNMVFATEAGHFFNPPNNMIRLASQVSGHYRAFGS